MIFSVDFLSTSASSAVVRKNSSSKPRSGGKKTARGERFLRTPGGNWTRAEPWRGEGNSIITNNSVAPYRLSAALFQLQIFPQSCIELLVEEANLMARIVPLRICRPNRLTVPARLSSGAMRFGPTTNTQMSSSDMTLL